MAIRCSSVGVVLMNNSKLQSTSRSSPSTLPAKVCMINKVFEDKEKGIICYRDQRGELVCEGYDEGPRICLQSPSPYQTSFNHNRHREIPVHNLLQQRVLQLVEGDELQYIKFLTLGEHC